MLIIGRTIVYTGKRSREALVSAILRVRRRLREVWARATSIPSAFPPGSADWDPDAPAFLDYLHARVSGLLQCPLRGRSFAELEQILQSLIASDPERPHPPEVWTGGRDATETDS